MKSKTVLLLGKFRTAAWYYKICLSGLIFVLGALFQFEAPLPYFNVPETTDPAIKAALLALFAACVLFLELMPTSENPRGVYASYINRAVGAILAFGAGWNWISSETDNQTWSYVLPLVMTLVYFVVGMTLGLLQELLKPEPKRTDGQKGISTAIQKALGEEHVRFRDGVADEQTRAATIGGYAMSLEINLANLLLLFRADPKYGLTQEKLDSLLQYADFEFGEGPAGDAARGHFRRIRMMIRGVQGETSPDP